MSYPVDPSVDADVVARAPHPLGPGWHRGRLAGFIIGGAVIGCLVTFRHSLPNDWSFVGLPLTAAGVGLSIAILLSLLADAICQLRAQGSLTKDDEGFFRAPIEFLQNDGLRPASIQLQLGYQQFRRAWSDRLAGRMTIFLVLSFLPALGGFIETGRKIRVLTSNEGPYFDDFSILAAPLLLGTGLSVCVALLAGIVWWRWEHLLASWLDIAQGTIPAEPLEGHHETPSHGLPSIQSEPPRTFAADGNSDTSRNQIARPHSELASEQQKVQRPPILVIPPPMTHVGGIPDDI